MSGDHAAVLINSVKVATTSGRGHTPEELSQQLADKIVYIGSNSHHVIRDQALVFQEAIRKVAASYLREAVIQHNATIAHRLQQAGHPDLVHLLGE